MDKLDSDRTEREEKPSSKLQLEPIYPWKKAWQTTKAIWPQLVYISLSCMSIPQYLLFVFSSQKAAERGADFAVKNALTLENGFGILRSFLADYLSVAWIAGSLFLIGGFSIIALIGQVSRHEEPSTPKALRTALRTLFPFGLAYILVLAIASMFSLKIAVQIFPAQAIKFFGLIALILLSALPTLLVIEPRGLMRATRQALRMSYAEFTGVSKWSIFFLLMTYQILAMNLIALAEWGSLELSRLDFALGLPRESFFQVSERAPFGMSVYFTEILNVLGFTISISGFLVLSGSLVFEIYRRHTLGRTISLAI